MKKILSALALLCLVGPVSAQTTASQGVPGNYNVGTGCPGGGSPCWYPVVGAPPVGYQQITSLSAATGLTVPTGAVIAVVVPETQAVRWRDDGTNPTASVGMPIAVGQAFVYTGNLAAIAFIEQTASAKLDVSYYK